MFEEELAKYQEVINDITERQHKPLTPYSRYFVSLLRDLASSFWSAVITAVITAENKSEILASEGQLFTEENPRLTELKDLIEQVFTGYNDDLYAAGVRRAINGIDLWDAKQLTQENVEEVVKYIKEVI